MLIISFQDFLIGCIFLGNWNSKSKMATIWWLVPGVCCFFFVFGKWLVPSFAFFEKIVPSSASSYLFSKVKTFWCININSECDYTFVLLFPCIHFFPFGSFFFFSHVITHLYSIMCIINWLLSSSSFSCHKTFSKNWQHLKPISTFTFFIAQKSWVCIMHCLLLQYGIIIFIMLILFGLSKYQI